MAAPESNGKLCTSLKDMEIGDYIKCVYEADTPNVAGKFSHLGELHPTYMKDILDEEGNVIGSELSEYEELPTTPSTTARGYFFLLKVDKGKLIADRMIQSQISWDELNKVGFVYGKSLDNMTGGGKLTLRIPSIKECYSYISTSTLNDMVSLKNNNVWNSETACLGLTVDVCVDIHISLCNDNYDNIGMAHYGFFEKMADGLWSNYNTPYYAILTEYRGGYCYISAGADKSTTQQHKPADYWYGPQYGVYNYTCFRPFIEYVDNNKSTNLFY